MMHPGDASRGAPPQEFVNCRCAVLPVVKANEEEDLEDNSVPQLTETIGEMQESSNDYKPFDMENNTFDKFKKVNEDFINSLPEDELEALESYTGVGARTMNAYLRTGYEDKWLEKDNLARMQMIMDKAPILGSDRILYRGTTYSAFGIDPMDLPDNPTADLFEHLIGTPIVDRGFMSTTVNKNITDRFNGGILLSIQASAETQGLYVESITRNKREYEFLLPPNSRVEILAVKETGIPGMPIEIEGRLILDEGK